MLLIQSTLKTRQRLIAWGRFSVHDSLHPVYNVHVSMYKLVHFGGNDEKLARVNEVTY